MKTDCLHKYETEKSGGVPHTNGVADPARLVITKAVEQSLTNGLRVCQVECPAKI